MSRGAAPSLVGRRAFPCCGGRVRLSFSPTPVLRRCPACKRRYQVEFRSADYTAARIGTEVYTIAFVELVRRGVAPRPVRADAPGQLGFTIDTDARDTRR